MVAGNIQNWELQETEIFLQFYHITRDLHLQFLGLVKLPEELRKWRDLCAFRVFPWKCETVPKIFELDDGYIQPKIFELDDGYIKSLSNQKTLGVN
ncbi:hypothetical protein MKW98_027259 [Papaver atlanticum]|uniref:Uncharacterized protein n=1 Tax=Papaver atlanticum TaxID=357466 RepID=A0AAD4SRF6_9MAGN|nr:hypothetical protein MKW98_027259 [Papaver atlanticum]